MKIIAPAGRGVQQETLDADPGVRTVIFRDPVIGAYSTGRVVQHQRRGRK